MNKDEGERLLDSVWKQPGWQWIINFKALLNSYSNTNNNKNKSFKLEIYIHAFQRQKLNVFSDEQKTKQFIASR